MSKYEMVYLIEGGSETRLPINASSFEEAEEIAARHVLKEVLTGDWRDDDGQTHGTAVWVQWTVGEAGEPLDYWEHQGYIDVPRRLVIKH